MALFESTLVLLSLSVVLLHLARRFQFPYPAVLAVAGVCVASFPWSPHVGIEPHLALALFVAPAVLDTAFALPPRELRLNWLPLTSLAVLLVVATTAAVAWVGWAMAGLPLAAAVVLGAIVSPPDAAAAAAVLKQFSLPRRTMVVLQGESLLNDAVALLIFGAGVAAAMSPGSDWTRSIPTLLLAAPGGIVIGAIAAAINLYAIKRVAGTLSAMIVQLTMTFGTWVVAERLHFSAIVAVVTLAMVVAHYLPTRMSASDRLNSNAIWAFVVFVSNVLAFFLMGLQAREVISRLQAEELWSAITFASVVLFIVVAVRVVWVLSYGVVLRRLRHFLKRNAPDIFVPSRRVNLLISWCGMRGLVTMATALALPDAFPKRDLIVLSAFFVVLGTLVLQGATIRPLITMLKFAPDQGTENELGLARAAMMSAAIETLGDRNDPVANAVRLEYEAARQQADALDDKRSRTAHDSLRATALRAQRDLIHQWRRANRINDETFHRLEQELDWAELHARPPEESQIAEG